MRMCLSFLSLFFFNDTATTEIYTLSLHDALPIYLRAWRRRYGREGLRGRHRSRRTPALSCDCLDRCRPRRPRSEEHTSELQSHSDLVCRLLLEKKKTKHKKDHTHQYTKTLHARQC